ncbi:outer membrane protein V [Beggiatoa alba B18LD]|uniref:Outer membrane protein V n=1 Tax=Beggiatoa alba B18LD TaxID=395493 RepID=I3CHK9_9GAMM|nr:MipA/OmpV family protein [Beggiatoa alba]EIJ43102.1 outer membrane protein V [Beggiatoa alba B18LD]
MRLRNLLVGFWLVCVVVPVYAAPPMGGAGWKGSLGLGVLWKAEPYKGEDDTILPIPLINLKYQRFYIQGFTVGYKLIDELEGSIDIIAQPRLEGYDASDNVYFEGMEDRDYSMDVGLALNAQFGRVLFNVTAVSDVLGYNDGQEVSASVGYNFVFGGTGQSVLRVTPTLGLKWLSANLVDYYYGVRAEEARLDRPQYTGDAGFNGTVGVMANYFFTTHSGISAGIQYEAFGNEIADSPLLEKDYSLRVFAGYSWMF